MLPDDQNISNSDDTRSQMSKSKLNFPEDHLLLPSHFYPGFNQVLILVALQQYRDTVMQRTCKNADIQAHSPEILFQREIIQPILLTILMLWSIGCTFRVPNTNRVPNTFSLGFAELNQPSLNTNIYVSFCQLLCNPGKYTPTVDAQTCPAYVC